MRCLGMYVRVLCEVGGLLVSLLGIPAQAAPAERTITANIQNITRGTLMGENVFFVRLDAVTHCTKFENDNDPVKWSVYVIPIGNDLGFALNGIAAPFWELMLRVAKQTQRPVAFATGYADPGSGMKIDASDFCGIRRMTLQ